jgi:hypothetical protein
MNTSLFLAVALALPLALSTRAEALKQNLVPANSRWILHLDAEAFRKSRIGAMIVEDKCESKVRQIKSDTHLDLDFSFSKVTALTAFGPMVGEHNNGVLLVQTTADVRSDFEKLIAFKEQSGNGEPPISRISENGVDLYKIHDELFACQAGEKTWLISKNKGSLLAARDVALGKGESMKDPALLNYPAINNNFFFVAIADTGSAGEHLPAQARILQKAEGGRLAIGESADKILFNLALRVKEAQTVSEMQQVAQGLIAFAKLAHQDNKDLGPLINSAAVKTNDNYVSVELSFPLDRAMRKVREKD